MKTPVTFEANGFKYIIIATNNRVEVSAHRDNSGFIGRGKTFQEALSNLNEAMEKAPLSD